MLGWTILSGKKKTKNTNIQLLRYEKCYVYNIFTTNFRWLLTVIVEQKSNSSNEFKFEAITTYHL